MIWPEALVQIKLLKFAFLALQGVYREEEEVRRRLVLFFFGW